MEHERAAEHPPEQRPAERPAAPAPAARLTEAPPVQQVLALQSLIGNHGVSSMLARNGKGPVAPPAPAPAGPVTENPEVESWGVRLKKGPQGPGLERTMDATTTKVFVGDTAVVHVKFKKLKPEDHDFIGSSLVTGGDVDVTQGWENATTMKWELKYRKVGLQTAKMQVRAGTTFEAHEESFLVVADLHDFTLACIEAQSTLLGKFNKATRKINEAASAFRKAYAEQAADLDDVSAQEKMIEDLVWGAVFAGAGGFAGGFVGGWLKTVKDGAYKNKDQIIDAAKDTVKFAVRSADKLRGGGTPSSKGDSTAPSVTDPGRPQGQRKASGKDPLDFLADLSATIAGEGEDAQAALTRLIHDAREARSANSKADFDEDPVAVVTKDLTLDAITAELNTDKKLWLRSLWKTWLGAYAYKAIGSSVQSNVGRKIRKKIEKAAKDCGESADAWIAEFGLPSKQKAEAEAAEYEEPIPYYGL